MSKQKIGLFADKLELPKARVSREPYIVALAAVEHGMPGGEREVQLQSKPAEGVTRNSPLDLGAMALCPPCDPGSFITVNVVVMESDEGYRRIGGLLAKARPKLEKSTLGRRLSQAAAFAGYGVALQVGRQALKLALGRMARNGDDVLWEGDIVLERTDEGWEQLGESWVVGNDKARLTVRLAESAEEGRVDTSFKRVKRWKDLKVGNEVTWEGEDGEVYVGHVSSMEDGAKKATLAGAPSSGQGSAVSIEVDKLASFRYKPDSVANVTWPSGKVPDSGD